MRQSWIVRWTLLGLAFLAITITLFPILWVLKISFSTQLDALSIPPVWFSEPTLEGFSAAWQSARFGASVVNSLIVALITLTVTMSVGLLGAYAFSRYRFPGSRFLLMALLFTRIFPPIAIVVPFFLSLGWLGLHDTHIGLALAYIAMDTPLAIWMLKGYFDAIPRDLEDCAMVDGASRFTAVSKITLPLMAPGIVATGIFITIFSWNEFLFALIITSKDAQTLPVVIAGFMGETGFDWPEIMAASATSLMPVLVLTFLLQKHIATGLSGGAVKG